MKYAKRVHREIDGRTGLFIAVFAMVFVTFTQYDVEVGAGRANYLLITVPMLMAIAVCIHIKIFGTLVLPKRFLVWMLIVAPLGTWVIIAGDLISLANYLLLFGTMAASGLMVTVMLKYPELSCKAIRTFLIISVTSLLAQVAYSAVTGDILDIHHLLFPFSRTSEISAADGFGFRRYNGFHLEPGSYAANIGTALMLLVGISGRVSGRMILVVLSTLLLTRSASALLYFGVILLVLCLYWAKKSPTKSILFFPIFLAALAIFVSVSGYGDYIVNRFASRSISDVTESDGSSRVKLENYRHLVNASEARQIIGSGFMKVDCDQCAYVNSNGAAFAIVFFFGAAGALLVVLMLWMGASRSLVGFMFVAMLLLSRHTFVQPNFWVPILALFANRKFGQLGAV